MDIELARMRWALNYLGRHGLSLLPSTGFHKKLSYHLENRASAECVSFHRDATLKNLFFSFAVFIRCVRLLRKFAEQRIHTNALTVV